MRVSNNDNWMKNLRPVSTAETQEEIQQSIDERYHIIRQIQLYLDMAVEYPTILSLPDRIEKASIQKTLMSEIDMLKDKLK